MGEPGLDQQIEGEGLLEFTGRGEAGEDLGILHPCLADEVLRRVVALGEPPPGGVDLEELGLGPQDRLLGARASGDLRGLDQAVGDVDAESVDSPVEPELQDGEEFLAHLLIAPVVVGLGRVEEVEVPLGIVRPVLDAVPGGPAEDRGPVVRRLLTARPLALGEDVAGALGGARGGGERRPEPLVLIGGMVRDDVHEDLDAQPVGGFDEGVETLEGAVLGVDAPVVGDVVAVVVLRGGVDGVEPYGIDAEIGEFGEGLRHSREVAEAVAVRILEGTDVDLIGDCVAPPGARLPILQVAHCTSPSSLGSIPILRFASIE